MAFLILAFNMISAIIPIRIADNSFWSSSTGIKSIKNFLDMVSAVESIDEYIMVTSDSSILQIADEYAMKTVSVDATRFPDRPYMFEECLLLAKKCLNSSQKKNDRFMFLDHRNLFLKSDDVEKAITVHEQNPGYCVLSLSSLKDHPCQYRAFFSFLGCEILRFKTQDLENAAFSDNLQVSYFKEASCKLKDNRQIIFDVAATASLCTVVFRGYARGREKLVSRIIPFNTAGPLYKYTHEILIPPQKHEIRFHTEIDNISGIIFIFTGCSQAGEYDTVEIFAPPGASWKWSGAGNEIIDSKKNEPLIGRQQFPPAYICDGSICLLNLNNLLEKPPNHFIPFHMENSCIVTDWVDYYCSGATGAA